MRELATDLFGSVFKYRPQLREPAEISAPYRVNRKLTGEGMGLPEYERLRLYTRLHEAESAVATEVILKEVLKHLTDEDRQALQRAAKADEQHQQALERAQALEEFLQEHPDQADRETQWRKNGKVQKLADRLETFQQWASEAEADLQDATQGLEDILESPALRPALRRGMEEATEDLEAFEQFCLSWGTEAGELQRLPAEEKLALMHQILGSPKLRRLAEMVGRLKRLALSKRTTRVTTVPEEVVDVTQGSNLARTLPSELALLEDPDREILFYERFLGGKLLEYELRGREFQAKGPIVCCVDNSGSMEGEREIWSKAVALALAEIARQDRRSFYVVHFGGPSDPLETFGIEPTDRGKVRLQKVLDIATYFLGGGTDFHQPLSEAANIIGRKSTHAAYRKADIVCITDGGARLTEDFQATFLKRKAQWEFRLFSVIILGTEQTLADVSDEVFHLMDLVKQGDRVAGSIFEGV